MLNLVVSVKFRRSSFEFTFKSFLIISTLKSFIPQFLFHNPSIHEFYSKNFLGAVNICLGLHGLLGYRYENWNIKVYNKYFKVKHSSKIQQKNIIKTS